MNSVSDADETSTNLERPNLVQPAGGDPRAAVAGQPAASKRGWTAVAKPEDSPCLTLLVWPQGPLLVWLH